MSKQNSQNKSHQGAENKNAPSTTSRANGSSSNCKDTQDKQNGDPCCD